MDTKFPQKMLNPSKKLFFSKVPSTTHFNTAQSQRLIVGTSLIWTSPCKSTQPTNRRDSHTLYHSIASFTNSQNSKLKSIEVKFRCKVQYSKVRVLPSPFVCWLSLETGLKHEIVNSVIQNPDSDSRTEFARSAERQLLFEI